MKFKLLSTLCALLIGLGAMSTVVSASHHSKSYGSYGDKAKSEKSYKKDIVETAIGNDDFSTLVTALQAADLVEALQGEGPFTVFAPVNQAFAALPAGTLDDLLKEENKEQLQSILTYHVVSGNIKSGDINMGTTEVTTLQGDTLSVVNNADGITVNGAKVVSADIKTSNGVIHVIDAVVLP